MQSWSGRPNGAGGRWSLIWDERLEGLFGLAQGEFDRTFEMYVPARRTLSSKRTRAPGASGARSAGLAARNGIAIAGMRPGISR